VVKREYCKKLIILMTGQKHSEEYHKKKEETFVVLYGEIDLALDTKRSKANVGEVITIKPGVIHAFGTEKGAIIEEISSTHYLKDSYYLDDEIMKNKKRKTFITYWI